ncbi:MAG: hypothetical protein GY869_18475 [Planctomycetes bacterium]|nr:hypothetical protein [Planctomycetota bacterium]
MASFTVMEKISERENDGELSRENGTVDRVFIRRTSDNFADSFGVIFSVFGDNFTFSVVGAGKQLNV